MRDKGFRARLVFVLVSLGLAVLSLNAQVTGHKSADLTVESLTMKPTAPTTDTLITFTIVIKNIGQGPAAPGKVSFKVTAGGLSSPISIDFPTLSPGAGHTIERKMKITSSGSAFAVAFVPSTSNERKDNNSKTLNFTVAAGNPDLIVDSFTINPASPTPTTEITFTGVVKNAGNAPAPPSKAQFSVSTQLFDVPQLAPGAKHPVVLKMKLDKAQNYGPTFTVDKASNVSESSETNNSKQIHFTVTAANPDLVVESFTISPSSPTTATEITFTGVVKNAGNAPAPASKAHFSVATKYFDVPQLAPGARYTVIHKMKLDRAQKYGPTFSVDRMRDVAESSESNNEKQIFFVVTQAK